MGDVRRPLPALGAEGIGGGFATPADVAAAIAAHEGAADPHAGYLTAAEGNAAYQPLDADLTALAALVTTGFGRSFLELATAAAGRTLLGLGSAAQSAVGDFQPADADLTALAALTTTAYGRSLLEAANAGALRTLAGLVIGTDVQAYDADLAAIAALATTTYGRGQLTLADAAADTAQLNAFTSALKGLAPASGGGTSNFLRADGTWAAPSGGADPWTHLKLAADYNNALATFANITDGTTTLQFTPAANVDWTMEARLLVWTTTATNLPRIGVNVAAGATAGMGGVNIWQAGATASASVHANAAWNNPGAAVNAQMAAGGVLTASVPWLCEITAAGRSGAAPTAITLQMACESAAATTCYVKRGSFLRHRTV